MTKVEVNPGVCGLMATIEAQTTEEEMITLKITSGCKGISQIGENLSEELDPYEVVFGKPGTGEISELAQEYCPGHAGCPVIAGIIKCIEAEAKLALPRNAEIKFI